MRDVLGRAPIPDRDPIVGPGGFLSQAWLRFFGKLPETLAAAPMRQTTVSLTTQGASIAATNLAPAQLAAGLYRATYYARITRAGTVSSTLTATIAWTDGGVACTYSGAAMTGNTTATVQSGTLMLRADKDTAINYSATYGSVGATSMQYSLHWVLEAMPS